MTQKPLPLSENTGLIHKLAVIGKDYYSIARIDDLFIFAGAQRIWHKPLSEDQVMSSMRMQNVYEWIDGVKENAPERVDKIIEGVASQMLERGLAEQDRQFLERVLQLPTLTTSITREANFEENVNIPGDVEKLLEILINGLPRAMHPLKHNRREGLPYLEFNNEYDVQSLMHSLLRPWIKDIRPEEFTPSYAGSSTRIDFLLPSYFIVCEVKYVRDKAHAKKIGDELIIDLTHYKTHPQCKQLWAIIYDPNGFIQNPHGLKSDLEKATEKIQVRTFILNN